MKLLASVLTRSGTIELQAETPLGANGPDARIGLVLPGASFWLTRDNARALVGLVEYALKLEESTHREEPKP